MSINRPALIGAMAALGACNIAFGLFAQAVPLAMEAQGLSARLVGAITAAGQVGGLTGGLLVPLALARIGDRPVALGSAMVLALALVAMALTTAPWPWFPLSLAIGMATAMLFTVSETWIQTAAGDQHRGRVMGLYLTMLTLTFGVGPFAIALTGAAGPAPWLVAAVAVAVGLAVMLAVPNRRPVPPGHEARSGFLAVLAAAPAVWLFVLTTSAFERTMLAFFGIWGIRNGLTESQAVTILGIGILSGVLVFYPVGRLADAWSRQGTILLAALVGAAASLALPLAVGTGWIWPVTVLVRAGGLGIYVIALTMVGDRFRGTELVTGSALVAIIWGFGGLVAPPLAGMLIDAFGAVALPPILAGLALTAALGAILGKLPAARPA